MAILVNEQAFVQDTSFLWEQRLNSPLSRFLDKTPTFVRYYHINNLESTRDEGFLDVESILSGRSPLRFQRIENFPLYGLEPIVLNLQDQDEGLDSEYSGDAVVLPNTIKPLPNDFFIITMLKGSYLFRVTEIKYDSIRPDNFYGLSFRLEYNDDEKIRKIEEQVVQKFSCVLENIGTELSCLISEEDSEQYSAVSKLYNEMLEIYLSIFYNRFYNALIGYAGAGYKLFDPLLSVFINKHRLLNKTNSITTIILSEGFEDRYRKVKYEKSIYRFFERKDVSRVNQFLYNIFPATYKKDSLFARNRDQSVYVMDIPMHSGTAATIPLLPERIVNSFKYDGPTESKYVELMQKFARNEELTINDIPLSLNDELLNMDISEEVYIFTPILLYILKYVLSNYGKI